MDANVLIAITAGLGISGGLWALVRWSGGRPGNGGAHPPPPGGVELPPASKTVSRGFSGGRSGRERFIAAPQPSAPQVQVKMFNSWSFQADTVYTLIPPENGTYGINLANLGPGALYLRVEADPAPGDPFSETLLAGDREDQIPIPVVLRVVVDQDSAVTARLIYR